MPAAEPVSSWSAFTASFKRPLAFYLQSNTNYKGIRSVKRTVIVWDKPIQIHVSRKYKTIWVAVGEYMETGSK